MSKKKKSFTVEEMKEYQALKQEWNRNEISLRTNQKSIKKAADLLDQLKSFQAERMKSKATLEKQLSKFSELELIPELATEPPTVSRKRQAKTSERMKTEMLLNLVSDFQVAPYVLRQIEEKNGLPKGELSSCISFRELHAGLKNKYGHDPKSVSNFFKKQLEGEELVGGSKNRTLLLPLKKTAKEFEEIR